MQRFKTLSQQAETVEETVEVVDAQDEPLLVMPLIETHRQRLRHRSVLVLLYNEAGALYYQKHSANKSSYPGRWDLSAVGHVLPSESREDAAMRELYDTLRVEVRGLKLLAEVQAGPETGYEFVTLYSADRFAGDVTHNEGEVQAGMFVDRDELASLVQGYREVLTPDLVYFFEKGYIFPE